MNRARERASWLAATLCGMRSLVVVLCVACGSSGALPDAFEPDSSSPVMTSFEWNPWPEGPVPYRVEIAACNDDAAQPGRCPAGFGCTGNVDVQLVAATRGERVCVATESITELAIDRFEPYAPDAPIDVPLVVIIDGEPFEGTGTLRLIDADGAEAYSGPLVSTSLALEPGELRAFVSVRRDARNPEWTRSGRVVVGEGPIVIELESGLATLEGEGRARLLNRNTGVDLETTLPATLSLVPGTYDVLLLRPEGSARQDALVVEAMGEHGATLVAEVVRAEGEVRVDGDPLSLGRVVFYDAETRDEVSTAIVDGRYAVDLVDRTWAVYLDTREVDGSLPQMRALTHEAVRASSDLDLDVSTVSLRGTYTVDGVAAPNLGTRWGFLQVVDALGIAGAGVSVQDGSFEGRVYASRASLVFIGTHATAPRLAQRVAEALLLDDVPIELDVRTAQLEIALRVDGGTFPVAPDIVPRGRGVVTIADDTRSLDALLPPRGEAIASIVVPPGRYVLTYVNDAFDEVPVGQYVLGEVDVDGETRADFDLELHEIFLTLPADAGRARFSGPGDSWADTEVTGAAAGTIRLFGGTWRMHELCAAGCGRLVLGWIRLADHPPAEDE